MSQDTPDRKHKTPGPAISAREVRFAQLLFEHGFKNYAQLYLKAGFPARATPAATDKAARRVVHKRLFRAYIRQIEADAAAAVAVTVEGLARGFKRAAEADVTRLMGPDGEMLPPSQWPEDVRLCITRLEVEELTELQPDPDNPRRKRKVAIGTKWKVWLENKTECRKVLAQWKRMVGADKEDGDEKKPDPLVVGGTANPDNL